ncbi:metallophosphoesterase family protein [Algoriphagus sp. PAP.12]|uniref:metallophosphoesterase family protein n=1 Tax=Algoriphagus sp. PAP.12 TaxID=2996678 RepID=UPI00227D518E|nr:metallophosphoesterase [Algoriphagus sp. PAP.12]
MQRRPFLQKITLLSSSLMTMPFMLYGKMDFPKTTKLKFITASDGHWGQPDTDFHSSHRNLIEAINQEKDVDFVVINGDLTHDNADLIPEVKGVFEQFKAPFYMTRGNHDHMTDAAFLETVGYPVNHSFQVKDEFGVVLLNCSNTKGEYLCVDMDIAQQKLEEFSSLPHVFVFVHISQNDWTRHGIDCRPFLDLLASYPNVRATFHGHDHDVDGIMLYKKKPFLWSGHFGGSWGNPFPSYRVVEVGEDGKAVTYLKTIKEGMILNGNNL